MKRLFSLLLAVTLLLTGCTFTSDDPASIKVMSWNILNPSWGGIPADMRVDSFFATLTGQMPDVIGLQEASSQWQAEFDALPAPYEAICNKTKGGKDCMTMFFYNTETLTLVESGMEDLDPASNIRVVSWAVFETQNGKQFLITNTHPDSRETECFKHTNQFLSIARALYTTYNLPTLSVGDFNALEGSLSYEFTLVEEYIDSKYAEGVEVIKDYDSYLLGDYGGTATRGKGSRDHIFVKGAVTPLTYETIYNDATCEVSDHLPVAAVVEIG